MKKNEGGLDRALRIIFGLVLLLLGIFVMKAVALMVIFIVIGALLLLTGLSGYCPLYKPLDVDTGSPKPEKPQGGQAG